MKNDLIKQIIIVLSVAFMMLAWLVWIVAEGYAM